MKLGLSVGAFYSLCMGTTRIAVNDMLFKKIQKVYEKELRYSTLDKRNNQISILMLSVLPH